MRIFFATIFFTTFQLISFGQKTFFCPNLLDIATKETRLFISINPIKKINLKLSDTTYYREYLKTEYEYNIDNGLLSELIQKSSNIDTALWTEAEMKNFLLIKNVESLINTKDAVKKISITDKIEIKKLKKRITDYNDSRPSTENIYFFSRPIFDNTNTFAIISHGTGNKAAEGKDYISLFGFNGSCWVKLGVITRWIY
ncbi:hypothetical protein ACI6Q2_21645 [Chitinophagaceae bacterium LWZ2-11]